MPLEDRWPSFFRAATRFNYSHALGITRVFAHGYIELHCAVYHLLKAREPAPNAPLRLGSEKVLDTIVLPKNLRYPQKNPVSVQCSLIPTYIVLCECLNLHGTQGTIEAALYQGKKLIQDRLSLRIIFEFGRLGCWEVAAKCPK